MNNMAFHTCIGSCMVRPTFIHTCMGMRESCLSPSLRTDDSNRGGYSDSIECATNKDYNINDTSDMP